MLKKVTKKGNILNEHVMKVIYGGKCDVKSCLSDCDGDQYIRTTLDGDAVNKALPR